MRLLRTLTLAAVLLAACGEKPQALPAAGAPGFKTDDWQHQLRERTLRQSESQRIYP